MTTQQILFVAGGSLFSIGLVALAPVLRLAWLFLDQEEAIKHINAQREEFEQSTARIEELVDYFKSHQETLAEYEMEIIGCFIQAAKGWSTDVAREKLKQLRADQQESYSDKTEFEPENYEPFIRAVLQVHPELAEVDS